MNFDVNYKLVTFNPDAMSLVKSATNNPMLDYEDGKLHNPKSNTQPKSYGLGAPIAEKNLYTRNSTIAWIQDPSLYTLLLNMVAKINKSAGWNFKITGVEPIQYGLYPVGGFYDWHLDQHQKPVKGQVRKISMSLMLNESFEGGAFDLEIYKPGTDPRYKTFDLSIGQAIFFCGHTWHRVQPVTKGIRESIVAWFYGPPYI
tara:strand:- start:76 stop:678 length:603 start_codon:yes stop_codon:yes gene_type:complete